MSSDVNGILVIYSGTTCGTPEVSIDILGVPITVTVLSGGSLSGAVDSFGDIVTDKVEVTVKAQH